MARRYDIMHDFVDGLFAGLGLSGIDDSKSEHWQAGYNAGYGLRKEKNRLLDEYLVSIGELPQAVVRVQNTRGDA